ncbi:MAG: hypothetical protein ABJH45_07855 [Paracoccaceae bacterium]
MHRQFIAVITATSIAITAFAAQPTRAGNDDVARTLAAIAGIAILGAAIKNSHDKKKERVVQHSHPVKPKVHRHVQPRPLPKRVNRKLLPQHCLHNFRDRHGNFPAFGRNCLSKNYGFPNSLPQHCARSVRANRGYYTVYGARCLSQNGFQIARR